MVVSSRSGPPLGTIIPTERLPQCGASNDEVDRSFIKVATAVRSGASARGFWSMMLSGTHLARQSPALSPNARPPRYRENAHGPSRNLPSVNGRQACVCDQRSRLLEC